jgi:hypothetical protein
MIACGWGAAVVSAEAEILTETEVAASACGVGCRENATASKAGVSNNVNVDGSREGFRRTKDPCINILTILTVLTDLPIPTAGRGGGCTRIVGLPCS